MADGHFDNLSADARALIARLKAEREQLELRMHLAKAELRDEWAGLEARWHDIEARARSASTAADAPRPGVVAAVKQLGDELAEAYRRVRNAIG